MFVVLFHFIAESPIRQGFIKTLGDNLFPNRGHRSHTWYPPLRLSTVTAMASVTFAKFNASSSQWIGQQSFSQRQGSSARFPARRVSVPIRAGSYSEELVQTAVSFRLFWGKLREREGEFFESHVLRLFDFWRIKSNQLNRVHLS